MKAHAYTMVLAVALLGPASASAQDGTGPTVVPRGERIMSDHLSHRMEMQELQRKLEGARIEAAIQAEVTRKRELERTAEKAAVETEETFAFRPKDSVRPIASLPQPAGTANTVETSLQETTKPEPAHEPVEIPDLIGIKGENIGVLRTGDGTFEVEEGAEFSVFEVVAVEKRSVQLRDTRKRGGMGVITLSLGS